MLKPLLLVVAAIALCFAGFAFVKHEVIYTSAFTGRPLDHLGDGIRCLKCGAGGVRAGAGYSYHCAKCNADYKARWNETTHAIDIDW